MLNFKKYFVALVVIFPAFFWFVPVASAASITVVSPTGSSVFNGTTDQIRFSFYSEGIPSLSGSNDVRMAEEVLFEDGRVALTATQMLGSSYFNHFSIGLTGQQTLSISSSRLSQGRYRWRIYSYDYPSIEAKSVVFTVGSPAPAPTVVTPAPVAPTINSFTADSLGVNPNDTTTLRWSVSNATECSINGVSVSRISGSRITDNLTSATTFTLNCLNGTVPASQSVTVRITPATLAITDKGNNNTGVWTIGQPITIKWRGTGLSMLSQVKLKKNNLILADGYCTLERDAFGTDATVHLWGGASGIPDCNPFSGSGFTEGVVAPGEYTLIIENGEVSATAPITVNPAPVAPTINSFTADSLSVLRGESTTLRWNVTGANRCTLMNMNYIDAVEELAVSPITTGAINFLTRYKLTCYNGSLSSYKTLSISLAQPVIDSFTADNESILAGQSTNLRWNVRGALDCYITGGAMSLYSVNAVSGSKPTGALNNSTDFELWCRNGTGLPSGERKLSTRID
ncbi:MAG TPA: hypothetical protein P5056_03990, partial [Candidatus Paceibacterota bacterium]|nr:hypothetical protein [Candidatus Paceibacterota bacterium]